MKLTDYSLVFLVVVLPIIIVVYINVSFSINAFNEEMYYTKLINTATQDASFAMKEVESNDPNNDYGYSGEFDNRVSVNPNIAVSAFFESLYTNLRILTNKGYQQYLDMHVPFLGIIDYNGLYICRLEKVKNFKTNQTEIEKIITPKRYFSYVYKIKDEKKIITEDDENFNSNRGITSIHNIEFTLDDRIIHNGCYKDEEEWKNYTSKTFFIADDKNNTPLVLSENHIKYTDDGYKDETTQIMINDQKKVFKEVVEHLKKKRKEVIINVLLEEINYSINSLNEIARSERTAYNFEVPQITTEEMDRYIGDTGIISFIQGLQVGNRYLEYKGYGSKDLNLTKKYYFTKPTLSSKFNMNLYHKSKHCPEYNISSHEGLVPGETYHKGFAATNGYFPCPICKP